MQPAARSSRPFPYGIGDRRRGYRQRTGASATLYPPDADASIAPVPIHLSEHSLSGVAFSTAVLLPIGSMWRMQPADPEQAARAIEIRSRRARNDGMYDVGAKYL